MGKWSEIVWYLMVVVDLQREDYMIHPTNLLYTAVDNVECLRYSIMRRRSIIVEPVVIGPPLRDLMYLMHSSYCVMN